MHQIMQTCSSHAGMAADLTCRDCACTGFRQLKLVRGARSITCFVEFSDVTTAMAVHNSQQVCSLLCPAAQFIAGNQFVDHRKIMLPHVYRSSISWEYWTCVRITALNPAKEKIVGHSIQGSCKHACRIQPRL